jgi:hypothetical protein
MRRPGPGGSTGSESTAALRWASLIYALAVAVATLLPSSLAVDLGIGAGSGPAKQVVNEALGYLAAAVAAALLIVIPWRLRLAKRLGVSWPLFLCALGYVVGMAYLASEDLRRATYELVVYDLPDWPEQAFGEIDPQHVAGYAGLGLLAGLAWRQQLHPVPTGGIVLAFGLLLEVLQDLVPGREPTPKDLTSNALGVLIGYLGIGLLALLSAEPGVDFSSGKGRRLHSHGRSGTRRKSHRGSRTEASRRTSRRSDAGRGSERG